MRAGVSHVGLGRGVSVSDKAASCCYGQAGSQPGSQLLANIKADSGAHAAARGCVSVANIYKTPRQDGWLANAPHPG
jgi:hypothetical protein